MRSPSLTIPTHNHVRHDVARHLFDDSGLAHDDDGLADAELICSLHFLLSSLLGAQSTTLGDFMF